MVTKSKAGQKKGRVKVGKLKLNKETVKDLTASEKKKVKGAVIPILKPPKLPTMSCIGCATRYC